MMHFYHALCREVWPTNQTTSFSSSTSASRCIGARAFTFPRADPTSTYLPIFGITRSFCFLGHLSRQCIRPGFVASVRPSSRRGLSRGVACSGEHRGATDGFHRSVCPWEKARKRRQQTVGHCLWRGGNSARALLAFGLCACWLFPWNLLGSKEHNPADKNSSALKPHRKRWGDSLLHFGH